VNDLSAPLEGNLEPFEPLAERLDQHISSGDLRRLDPIGMRPAAVAERRPGLLSSADSGGQDVVEAT
jgi:hypothetical protein